MSNQANESMIFLKSPMNESSITKLLFLEEKNEKETKQETILKDLLDIYTVK